MERAKQEGDGATVPIGVHEPHLTETQVKYMVGRFLSWRLPDGFNPDGGISFKKTHSETGPSGPQKHEPVGTNLFDAAQAEEMVRYMLDGMPMLAEPSADHSPEKDTSGEHEWFTYGRLNWECCKVCGIVRRIDGKNSPCKGPSPVGPRDRSS